MIEPARRREILATDENFSRFVEQERLSQSVLAAAYANGADASAEMSTLMERAAQRVLAEAYLSQVVRSNLDPAFPTEEQVREAFDKNAELFRVPERIHLWQIFVPLPAEADDAARLETLRKYLFEENGFHGSRGDFYNRANSYLNEVLDDREGLPITLSVVYMELARRVGLDVAGVGLPGHFVIAHVPKEGERQLIDVFDGAKNVARDEALRRVRENTEMKAWKSKLSDEDLARVFEPIGKRAIIFRMLSNLLNLARGNPQDLHRYLNAMLAIEPDHGQYHWLRAMVRYELDERQAARADVARRASCSRNVVVDRDADAVLLARARAVEAQRAVGVLGEARGAGQGHGDQQERAGERPHAVMLSPARARLPACTHVTGSTRSQARSTS